MNIKQRWLLLSLFLAVFAGTLSAATGTMSRHPEWAGNAVIYEVNVRQYTPSGTFKEFEKHLPRLKEMGVDILWLMPVNPIGEKNRKGTLGSYYSVQDYLKVNPEFGTMDDFRDLVRKAHASGMKIIIDWVANHTSWDNPLIYEHPDYYKKDSSGKIIAPVSDWTDVAALDYSKQGLREYMKNAMLFWIKEADIDGFRCDVAEMVPAEFWEYAIPELRKEKEIFMLAEAESPRMHEIGFDMTYSWNLFHTMKAISKGEKKAYQIDSVLLKDQSYPHNSLRMRFTSNHDENSWAGTEYQLFGDHADIFAAMTFLLPGMPLIYSGQEAGLNKKLRFFDKDTIDWTNLSRAKFYSSLIKLKKSDSALEYNSSFVKVRTDKPGRVYSFIRENGSNKVLAVFNLSAAPVTVSVSAEGSDKWKSIYPEQSQSDLKKLTLNAWEYRIFGP